MQTYFKKINIFGLKSFIAVISILIFYWQDFNFLLNEALNNDITSHIIIIPLFIIVIIYRIRYRILASMIFDNSLKDRQHIKDVVAILLILLSYILKIYGSYTFQPLEYHILSLPIFISGLILLLFTYQTVKVMLFPIIFTLLILPPPVQLAQQIGSDLSVTSSQISYFLLKSVGFPVSLVFEYGTPVIYLISDAGTDMPFMIDIACSGLYSLIGFLIFTIFIAYLSRSGILRKITILVIGIPVIYSLNILRITLIITVGHFLGPNLALEALHFFGGWVLIFLGTSFLILVLDKVFKINLFKAPQMSGHSVHSYSDGVRCDGCGIVKINLEKPAIGSDYIRVVAAIMITIVLVSIRIPVFTLTEVKAEIMDPGPFSEGLYADVLPSIEGYETRFVYRDSRFEEVAGQDAALMFRYRPLDYQKDTIWVGIELGSTKYVLHPWEVCLITYPTEQGNTPRYTQVELKDIHLMDNPPTAARFFVSKEKATNITQAVLYWYMKSIFIGGDEYAQKWIKISVIKYIENDAEINLAEREMVPVAISILNYWQPISKWSWIALTIAEQGKLIMIILSGFILLVSIYKLNEIRIDREKAKNFYHQIKDERDKHLVGIINILKKGVVSINDIIELYNKTSDIKMDVNELELKLVELEKLGIVEKKLTHIDDYPYITYKLNLKYWN